MLMETLNIPSDTSMMGYAECDTTHYSSHGYSPDYLSCSNQHQDSLYDRSDSVSSYDTRKDSTSSYDRKDSSSSSLFEDQYLQTPSYISENSDPILHQDLAGSMSNMSISSADSGLCELNSPSPYNYNATYDTNTVQSSYENNSLSLFATDSNSHNSPRQRKSACRVPQKSRKASTDVSRRCSAPARQAQEGSSRKDSRVYDVQLESDNVLLFVPDLDLVKSHLMYAVRAEVDVLKDEIGDLQQHISRVERENQLLRQYVPQEALQLVGQVPPRRSQGHGNLRGQDNES